MYKSFRQLCERWLRIPPMPEAPPGDEESAQVFRAAPKFLTYLRIRWALRSLISLVFAFIPLGIFLSLVSAFSRGRDVAPEVLTVTVVILFFLFLILRALLSLAMVQLDYEKRWYVVTDRSLRIREGIGTVREITFTFANIQNLGVTQGPIQRALGIADLKVETAGGGSAQSDNRQQSGPSLHTAFFRGIDNAEEIKQLIAIRMRRHSDAGLGDHDEHQLSPLSHSSSSAQLDALHAVLAEAKTLRTSLSSH